jgi:hypothetical protein
VAKHSYPTISSIRNGYVSIKNVDCCDIYKWNRFVCMIWWRIHLWNKHHILYSLHLRFSCFTNLNVRLNMFSSYNMHRYRITNNYFLFCVVMTSYVHYEQNDKLFDHSCQILHFSSILHLWDASLKWSIPLVGCLILMKYYYASHEKL